MGAGKASACYELVGERSVRLIRLDLIAVLGNSSNGDGNRFVRLTTLAGANIDIVVPPEQADDICNRFRELAKGN